MPALLLSTNSLKELSLHCTGECLRLVATLDCLNATSLETKEQKEGCLQWLSHHEHYSTKQLHLRVAQLDKNVLLRSLAPLVPRCHISNWVPGVKRLIMHPSKCR